MTTTFSENTMNNMPDQQQLQLSIVIYNYESAALESLLSGIFGQRQITSFEVILCDDSADSHTWEIGNRYALAHPERITLIRNQIALGPQKNSDTLRHMINGRYYAELSRDRRFDPGYVLQVLSQLEADPLFVHSFVGKKKEIGRGVPNPEMNRRDEPMVSICIYNYNYGHFLLQCLESVAVQTYKNIEICFSDNASTDDSWQIAQDFAKRHEGKMSLIRNRKNFGASVNLNNCRRSAQGKYLMYLCSDDSLKPEFVERCVTSLEKYPEAAFAMVHRDIMDDNGSVVGEPSFYDQTCLIPGEEQAAVYMMAAVNPSISQILYNHAKLQRTILAKMVNLRWFGQRMLDFELCFDSPVIYIKEPLLLNRVHGQSDGTVIDASLIQGVGQYVLAHQLAEAAAGIGLEKPVARLDSAVEKVGRLCLRYCTHFLLKGDEITALRYLHLAQAIYPGVVSENVFVALQEYWQADGGSSTSVRKRILDDLSAQEGIASRKVSYAPPPGSIPC